MAEQFNAGLLRIARQARGWSQTQLTKAAAVSQAHLSKIENSLLEPTPDVVTKLATALEFPESFFFQNDRVVGLPVSFHPMWRKRASVGKRLSEKLEAEINIRTIHIRRLLSAVEIEPDLQLPQMDVDDYGSPEDIAATLRRAWLIPSGPILDLVGVVESAGCIVSHCDFPNSSVDGMTVQISGLPPCIFLNQNQPADRQRFSLAHELGHVIMHKVPSPEMEDEANEFASALLMPRGDIRSQFGRRLTIQKLAALKPAWRVSMAALLFRAKTVGAITENQSSYLWRQMSTLGLRKSEPPELDFAPEQPTVLPEMVRLHLEDLGYNLTELAAALHLQPQDTQTFLPLPKRTQVSTLRVVK